MMLDLDELAGKIKGDNEDWKDRDRAMREQIGRDANASGHKIEIHVTPTGIGSTISIDEQELPQVRAFSVYAESGKPSRVVVDFVGADVTITGAVDQIVRESRLAGSSDAAQASTGATRGMSTVEVARLMLDEMALLPAAATRCTSGHRSKPLIDSDEGWESMSRSAR